MDNCSLIATIFLLLVTVTTVKQRIISDPHWVEPLQVSLLTCVTDSTPLLPEDVGQDSLKIIKNGPQCVVFGIFIIWWQNLAWSFLLQKYIVSSQVLKPHPKPWTHLSKWSYRCGRRSDWTNVSVDPGNKRSRLRQNILQKCFFWPQLSFLAGKVRCSRKCWVFIKDGKMRSSGARPAEHVSCYVAGPVPSICPKPLVDDHQRLLSRPHFPPAQTTRPGGEREAGRAGEAEDVLDHRHHARLLLEPPVPGDQHLLEVQSGQEIPGWWGVGSQTSLLINNLDHSRCRSHYTWASYIP